MKRTLKEWEELAGMEQISLLKTNNSVVENIYGKSNSFEELEKIAEEKKIGIEEFYKLNAEKGTIQLDMCSEKTNEFYKENFPEYCVSFWTGKISLQAAGLEKMSIELKEERDAFENREKVVENMKESRELLGINISKIKEYKTLYPEQIGKLILYFKNINPYLDNSNLYKRMSKESYEIQKKAYNKAKRYGINKDELYIAESQVINDNAETHVIFFPNGIRLNLNEWNKDIEKTGLVNYLCEISENGRNSTKPIDVYLTEGIDFEKINTDKEYAQKVQEFFSKDRIEQIIEEDASTRGIKEGIYIGKIRQNENGEYIPTFSRDEQLLNAIYDTIAEDQYTKKVQLRDRLIAINKQTNDEYSESRREQINQLNTRISEMEEKRPQLLGDDSKQQEEQALVVVPEKKGILNWINEKWNALKEKFSKGKESNTSNVSENIGNTNIRKSFLKGLEFKTNDQKAIEQAEKKHKQFEIAKKLAEENSAEVNNEEKE